MTKKQKILDLFNSIEWFTSAGGEIAKMITLDDFAHAGLYGDVENAKQHCDVIYARKIIQSLGHKVIVGGAMYIWKDKK